MKTLSEYNEMFEKGKYTKSVNSTNGRKYFFHKINESEWMFSFSSKRNPWYDEKLMTYYDLNKFLNAVNRILKSKV